MKNQTYLKKKAKKFSKHMDYLYQKVHLQLLNEAVKLTKKIGYPVVMKIASPQIIHKSDAGGVKVNLIDYEVKSSFQNYYQKCKKLQQESRN